MVQLTRTHTRTRTHTAAAGGDFTKAAADSASGHTGAAKALLARYG